MALGLVIVAVISCVFLYFWWLNHSKIWKTLSLIPGPKPLPLPLGNAHQLEIDSVAFYHQILDYTIEFKKDGILKLWLGPTPMIALYRADTVEQLLNGTKHMSKSEMYRFLHPWLGTGLLTSAGSKWKSRRKMLTPTFHFKILNDFLEVFNEQSEIMVNNLAAMDGKGEFDVFPIITHCALDIICDTAMGSNVNAQGDTDSDYVKAVYKISELIHHRQKQPWLWPDLVYSVMPSGREFERCLKILHSFTRKVIKERKVEFEEALQKQESSSNDEDVPVAFGKKKRLAFLDMLLYAAIENQDFTEEDIREEVDTFMFEGHDTTAAAANWATYLIGMNPDVQTKLQEEVDAVLGRDNRHITMDDLKELKYLDCVIKETLRLYPSVPMFGRAASEDFKIGEYLIPKDTQITIVTSALHRDPKYFPDPEKFDPDRFLPDNAAGRHPYCYVPFSAGMRNCIGQKFAVNEEKVLLASILRNFNIESLQKKEELYPSGELILRPRDGIKIKLTKRQV